MMLASCTKSNNQEQQAKELVVSMTNAVRGYELKVESRTEKAEKQRREIDELGLEIDRVRSRAKMLDDLEKNMEGYQGSVRSVMKESKRGALNGIHGPLSQLITVKDKYSVAVETALGASIQNVVVDNGDESWGARVRIDNEGDEYIQKSSILLRYRGIETYSADWEIH